MKILFLALLCTLSTAVFAADARIAGFKVKSLRVSSNTGNTYVMPNSPVQQAKDHNYGSEFLTEALNRQTKLGIYTMRGY